AGSLAPLPHCRSDQLHLSVPRMCGAAAVSLIESFTFSNVSRTSCALGGWPAVRRLDAAGQPIATTLSRWVYTQRGRAPYRAVRLRPGGTATFPAFGE